MLILYDKLEFLITRENFPLKKGNFWPIGKKDGDFLFLSTLLKMRFILTLYQIRKEHLQKRNCNYVKPCFVQIYFSLIDKGFCWFSFRYGFSE